MSNEAQFKVVSSDMCRTVRWTQEPSNENQKSNSVYLGDVVEGELVEKKSGVGDNNSWLYIIKLNTGEEVGVWGNKIIDPCFAKINVWDKVRITNLGFKKAKRSNREFRNYLVESAPAAPPQMTEVKSEQPTY